MKPETAARLAYAANILILGPVLWSLFAHSGDGALTAFGGTVRNEDGLRLLVASLWLAILMLSAVGLARPKPLLAVLALQVVYKACYLAVFVLPALVREGWSAVPVGVAVCFLVIVALWPLVIYRNLATPPDGDRILPVGSDPRKRVDSPTPDPRARVPRG